MSEDVEGPQVRFAVDSRCSQHTNKRFAGLAAGILVFDSEWPYWLG